MAKKMAIIILGVAGGFVVGSLPANAADTTTRAGVLPGTSELTAQGDLAAGMVDGIRAHLEKLTATMPAIRDKTAQAAKQGGPEGLGKLLDTRREKLREVLGVEKNPQGAPHLEYVERPESPSQLAEKDGIRVRQVRWNALEGLQFEGLLLDPGSKTRAVCVLLPHAGQAPEELAGLTEGDNLPYPLAWELAIRGCRVIIPVMLGRGCEFSVNKSLGKFTNQPHREFVYRMLYEMGRTPQGLEVEASRSALTWLLSGEKFPSLVAGFGDGGRVALAAAAIDPRFDACWARGAFGPREGLWQEPIDRNTWDLLQHVGDAEQVELIAPRFVLVEACPGPSWDGPPKVANRGGAAPGRLAPFQAGMVRSEFTRIDQTLWANAPARPVLAEDPGKAPVEMVKLANLVTQRGMGLGRGTEGDGKPPKATRPLPSALEREGRQMARTIEHAQVLWRHSEKARLKLWKDAPPGQPEKFDAGSRVLRDYFHKEVIGELPLPSLPMNPKSRPWRDGKNWKGFEITLDLEPGIFAHGIILLPNDLKPGERRPVVVCQHGLEGRWSDVCEPDRETPYYRSFGAKLADRGYIVFAPQNCYIGQDRFRVLQRMGNPLKLSLFSFIIRQHERIIDWLKAQPWTATDKVAFYGLSYGGKTAMRVPAVLPGYCLSICSGDFNEWIGKNVSYDYPGSYMYTGEYEMFEFNLGHTFNYAEMAYLIAPRPFLVERGHDDGVGIDEMVAWEFAKVRRLYSRLKQPEKTGIAFFAGGHEVQGVESFPWLDKQLGFTPTRR